MIFFSKKAFLQRAPLLLILVHFSAQAQVKSTAKRPNIVYILADEWRAQATGYAGDPNVKTPNLDQLAKESANFSNAVSILPVCTPHRAALLTGRFPQHTGMFMNDLYLPASELTLAEIYKSAGYNTGYIGKWHLDGHGREAFIPQERRQGFGYWYANECTHNYNHSKYFAGNDTTGRYWPGYDVYAQTTNAQQYIKDQSKSDKPFVLVIGYGAPHFPHKTAPENMKAKYDEKSIVLRPNVPANQVEESKKEAVGYYAHCTAIDSCIGALRETLKEAGIEQNTILVFTADHGEMLGSQDVHPSAKQRPWDEAIRVPFLLHYPALATSTGKKIAAPINTPDILPTLLSLSSIPKPATIEGDDLSELVTGESKLQDRAALIMNMAPFSENYKGKEYRGIRTSRYTFVRSLEGPWLLFDNQKDPYQLNNLANKPEAKALQAGLDKQLKDKLASLGDEFKPREYYINLWGYKVSPKKGEIPYSDAPRKPQSPKLK
ncbi:MAG: hypothetical protein K0S09_480 [Sphingobacteriaceae bacterium]|jgi:arylsulfatase A-like enzyme|nr:hypothetical protein [Sphingobacteriaceae bacterium]